MKKFALTVLAVGVLVAPVASASAGHNADHVKGPKTESKAKAYGKYCQGQSKKHVKGQKGTDFSRCVTAMAKAAKDDELTGREACKALSKKHVKGEKGTPFSRCVVGVAQMRKDDDA